MISDPVEFELFKNSIFSIADEMALTIFRTTYSGVLKDNMDYSTAMFTADGSLVAQGLTLPAHLGSMPTAKATRPTSSRRSTSPSSSARRLASASSTCRSARRRRRATRTIRCAWPSSAPSKPASSSSPRLATTASRRTASWSTAASPHPASRLTPSPSARCAPTTRSIAVTMKWRRGARRVRR